MEGINKSFDLDKMLNDVENAFEKYESEQKDGKVLINMAKYRSWGSWLR